MENETALQEQTSNWQPLTRVQRRIIGVLIEKSKTTPNSYPLTLNSITTASNQKSSRNPRMNLEADDVDMALEELREIKAVVEIQGDGRVYKYKHTMYQWMGVDKVELAIMGELLLRGEQTLGELRSRAARMEPIASLETLKPLIRSLIDKGLIVELTPEGRGQIITHNLYLPEELEHLKSKAGTGSLDDDLTGVQPIPAQIPTAPSPGADKELKGELDALKSLVNTLSERIEKLEQAIHS